MTLASKAIQAWQNSTLTVSIPQCVADFGGDHFAVKAWQHRFYRFPDDSWICTKGIGSNHSYAIGTGNFYKPTLMARSKPRTPISPKVNEAALKTAIEACTNEARGQLNGINPARLIEAYLAALSSPTHRHKNRGTLYTLIGIGKMQTSKWGFIPMPQDWESADMAEVAIYRSVDDGSFWVRPKEEFEDGRFEDLK